MSNKTRNIIDGSNGAEDLLGTGGADSISGYGGNDRLYGRNGDDVLDAGAGNDRLDGGAGADTMYGGSGNDVYVVDNVGDVVSEELSPRVDSGGIDTVQSSISHVLGAFVERLDLRGTADLNGAGNALANLIKGTSGANVISGREGVDTLYGFEGDDTLIGGADRDYLFGGTGSDTFVLSLNEGTPDVVYDFEAEDRIGIYASVFGLEEGAGLTGGQLDPAYFVAGSAATSVGHGQFLFTSGSKPSLRWDPDGAGGQAAATLATFSSGVVISADQFSIFATPPTASVATTAAEPQAEDSGKAYFTLSLTQPWFEDVILTVSTVNGTAAGGSDFVALSSVQVLMVAGQVTAYVAVDLIEDGLPEANETFSLRIDAAEAIGSGHDLDLGTASAGAIITDPGPSVVAINTVWQYGIPDPSGITYNPLTGKLILSDAEIEEDPVFSDISIFEFDLAGGGPTAAFRPGYTTEPTGLAIDAANGVIYVSDDDEFIINVVDLNDPAGRLWSFDSRTVGADDPEDVAVDPVTGNLFIVNGLSRSLQEVQVDHVNRSVSLVDSFTFGDPGILDPEALAYSADHDLFLVGGGFGPNIWLVGRDGNTIDVMTLLEDYRNTATDAPSGSIRTNVKDIALAPASSGSGATHIYVADFGDSHKIDGRIIEIDPGNLFGQFLIA